MQNSDVRWKEIALVAVSLLVIGALQIVLAQAGFLFSSHFWLDELFTGYIVTDPDLLHALEGLRNAVDTNPPTLHLLLRGWTGMWGESEVAFRSFALLAMYLAMLGIYLVLRGLFPPLPALVGVLAVWCHPLIVRHAFEARFYGPWLAGVVWFTLCLSRSLKNPQSPGWWFGVALTSMFVCTIHYFGVFTLGLVTLFVLWGSRPWNKQMVFALGAVAPGPLALAGCLSFFLGQRRALMIGTWIEPLDLAGIVVGLSPLLAVFCLYYLRGLLTKYLPADADYSGVLGLLGLTLLTPVLTLFSLLVQPATMARYILPSLAALGPLAAFPCYRLNRALQVVFCLVLFGLGVLSLKNLTEHYQKRDEKTDVLIAAIRALPEETPVAFEFTDALYVVDYYAPDLRFRCFFLDFEREQIPEASKHRVVTRDVARQVARFRGHPGLMSWQSFQGLPRHLVVAGDEEWDKPLQDVDQRFPGFFVAGVRGGGMVELTRR